VLSNIALRLTWRTFGNRWGVASTLTVVTLIMVMSYVVAFMETFTIQNFPYYHIPDRHAMYVYGSMFYALYFVVSFPMFLRMDEHPGECWSLSRATIDGLAACMLITQALDFWRIWIGPIVDLEMARASALAATPEHLKVQPPSKDNGVPFVY
jgi:cycloeucalenol cycloisomerase